MMTMMTMMTMMMMMMMMMMGLEVGYPDLSVCLFSIVCSKFSPSCQIVRVEARFN